MNYQNGEVRVARQRQFSGPYRIRFNAGGRLDPSRAVTLDPVRRPLTPDVIVGTGPAIDSGYKKLQEAARQRAEAELVEEIRSLGSLTLQELDAMAEEKEATYTIAEQLGERALVTTVEREDLISA